MKARASRQWARLKSSERAVESAANEQEEEMAPKREARPIPEALPSPSAAVRLRFGTKTWIIALTA